MANWYRYFCYSIIESKLPQCKVTTESPQSSSQQRSSPYHLSWQNGTSAATNERFNFEDSPPYFLPALPVTTNMFRPCVQLNEKARAKTSAINYDNSAALCRGLGLVEWEGQRPEREKFPERREGGAASTGSSWRERGAATSYNQWIPPRETGLCWIYSGITPSDGRRTCVWVLWKKTKQKKNNTTCLSATAEPPKPKPKRRLPMIPIIGHTDVRRPCVSSVALVEILGRGKKTTKTEIKQWK